MAFSIGQKVKVKQSYRWADYRGRKLTVHSFTDDGIRCLDIIDTPLYFDAIDLEPIEVSGRCCICDAITPGRTRCCDHKDAVI